MRISVSPRYALALTFALLAPLAGCSNGGSQIAPAVIGQAEQSAASVPFTAIQPDSIVYTPVNKKIRSGRKVKLDLNNDRVADFSFLQLYTGVYMSCGIGPPCLCGAIGGLWVTPQRHGNGVENGATSGWAAALGYGSQIDSQVSFSLTASVMNAYAEGCLPPHHRPYNDGYWTTGHSAYLGLEFKIHGHTHYGWAQLTAGDGFATLTGYAYETVAGESINAGQTK
jgi:hypothetical protein